MKGEEVKNKLNACGISLSEIARRLNMSQQAFSQALNRTDIKTGLIEKICHAINVDLSFFYDCAKCTMQTCERKEKCCMDIAFCNNNKDEYCKDAIIEELKQLIKDKDALLKDKDVLIAAKDELIEILNMRLHNTK